MVTSFMEETAGKGEHCLSQSSSGNGKDQLEGHMTVQAQRRWKDVVSYFIL